MHKEEIIKFSMAWVCALEKVPALCKLCFMLMQVFGRTKIVYCTLTMNILAFRAILALNFVEKACLILVNKAIFCVESF